MKTKICTKCNQEKSLTEFHNRKDGVLGVCNICKNCSKIYKQDYYVKNKSIIRKRIKKYVDEHKQKVFEYRKNWEQNNKFKRRINKRNTERNRLKTDINFRFRKRLRSRLSDELKGRTKSKNTLKLLDCSIEELKKHLESKFTNGMNWNNYGIGGWVIDHIRPCASFNLSKSSEQKKCFHYSNLQPLWEEDNLVKSDKYNPS